MSRWLMRRPMPTLAVKRDALEQLVAASGQENHSEVQWLEQEINSATIKEDQ